MNTKKIILLVSLIASSLQGMNTGNEDQALDPEFLTWLHRANDLISLDQYKKALKNLTTLVQEIELNNSITADHLILYDKTVRSMQLSSQSMFIDIQFIPNFIKKIRNHAFFVSSAIEEKKKVIKKADEEAKQWLQKKIYTTHDYTIQDLKLLSSQLKDLTLMLSRNFRKNKPECPKTLISGLHSAYPGKKTSLFKAVQKSSDAPTFVRTTLRQIQNHIPALKNAQVLNDLR